MKPLLILSVLFLSACSKQPKPKATVSEPKPTYCYSDAAVFTCWGDKNRNVYTYSLIPGGVESDGEFQAWRHADPVLESHYHGIWPIFEPWVVTREDVKFYASYRVGDRIFWTKKQVTIHKGETIFKAWTTQIRARCGNRLSETPQQPTRQFEPPDLYTDTPRVSIPPTEEPPIVPITPQTVQFPPIQSAKRAPVRPIPQTTHGPGYRVPNVWIAPPVRMVSTPEPGTWLMMACGVVLVGLGIARKR